MSAIINHGEPWSFMVYQTQCWSTIVNHSQQWWNMLTHAQPYLMVISTMIKQWPALIKFYQTMVLHYLTNFIITI